MITEDRIRDALWAVTDPEIGYSIIDLGLVYGIEIDQEAGTVKVRMTLTSPMCPMGPEIMSAADMRMRQVPGVNDARIELVWDPPWDPRKHASADVKFALGIYDEI
ncbi:MAG: metal-sulfur cluster assembly factor [Acidobacteria bacterium]|nr:metal-sulfur cluster assembly factor [Acidobacteriota bacterium]